jgi:hypothetical protein
MINPKIALEKLFTPCGIEKLANDKLQFIDLHIIDGCNYKCSKCFKFSPLCKGKGEMDYDKVIKDLEQLSKVTNKELRGISIIGGEPLFSKDIVKYMNETRRLFPNTDITIISNGVLIPNMPKEFFESLKRDNIMIAISKYHEDKFYTKIEETLQNNGCGDRFVYSCIKEMGCAMFLKMELDEEGRSDPKEIWDDCSAKNGCVLLKDGKLWSCSNHCMKYLLNEYFGTNLIDYEEDGIDIYHNDLQGIIEHLKKPKKGCRYCTKHIYDAMYFPQWSSLSKNEWIRSEETK